MPFEVGTASALRAGRGELEPEDGEIVLGFPFTPRTDLFQDLIEGLVQRDGVSGLGGPGQARFTEAFLGIVANFGEPVRIEEQAITWREMQRVFLVIVVPEPDRKAAGFDDFRVGVASDVNRSWVTRRDEAEVSAGEVENAKKDGEKLLCGFVPGESLIESASHGSGGEVVAVFVVRSSEVPIQIRSGGD